MTADKALEMPDMPADGEGPVFREPWHAEAFSLAVALHRRGAFTWSEWVEFFSGTLGDGPVEQDETIETIETAYYRRWLGALENLVAGKRLISVEEMARRKEEWRRAYLYTPHGQPVELKQSRGARACEAAAPRQPGEDRAHPVARPAPVAVSVARAGGPTRLSF
jgi:nitrile hydratase accessory protein